MIDIDMRDREAEVLFTELNEQNAFKSVAVPRPIGFIGSVSKDGVHNLAAYSQFTNVNFDNPHILFAAQLRPDGTRKDSVVNAEETGCFTHNMVTYSMLEAMNKTAPSYAPDVDEFEMSGLTKVDSLYIPAKRVLESPVQMECEWVQTVRLPGRTPKCTSDLVIGRVICIHVDENYVLPNGKLDILKIRPLARLGYADYTTVTEVFESRVKSMLSDPIPGSYGWMSPTRGLEVKD